LLSGRVLTGTTDSALADLARAETLVDQALVGSPRYPFAHFVKGQVLRAQQRWQEAIGEYETALAFDRNLAGALGGLAWCKLNAGSIEEVIPLVEEAIRLSPRDPLIGVRYYQIGIVHLLQSHTEEAIVWLEKARNVMPTQPRLCGHLASAYALKGDRARAATELTKARRLSGDDRFSSLARLRAVDSYEGMAPRIRVLFEAAYFAGLRKAGMPEE